MRKRKSEHIRFLGMVNQTEGCWLWLGTTYRRGYGHFGRWINEKWKMYKAHRYSYEYFNGPIPDGLLIRHTCDIPACVNPAHLLVGTAQDNINDRKERKGIPLIRNPRHNNLTKEIAMQIRQYRVENPTEYGYSIAQKFGTSKQQISRILRNEIWGDPA